MLGRAVRGVHKQQIYAATAQGWVLPHPGVPAHVASVQDDLRPPAAGALVICIWDTPDRHMQLEEGSRRSRTSGETFWVRLLRSNRNITAPGHCRTQRKVCQALAHSSTRTDTD